MPKAPAERKHALSVRLPEPVWARVERFMRDTEADTPGVQLSANDAIRALVLRALDAEDRRRGRAPEHG